MPVQKRLAQIALAKQTAKGTPATTGDYQIGVTGGSVVSTAATEAEVGLSWASRVAQFNDRTEVAPASEFDTLLLPQSAGLLIYGATGAVATTGAADPYVHTFTPGVDLPYLTVFARQGDEYHEVDDYKIDSLELDWTGIGAVTAKVKGMGCAHQFLGATPYTATADERPAAGVFKGAGGTFTVEGTAATVKSGNIKIENKLETIYGSDSVLPKDVFPGEHACTVSLTVIPEDLSLFREVITGTSTGTTPSAMPHYGTLDLKWIVLPGGTHSLEFNGLRVKYLTTFPAADPNGGAIELALEGVVEDSTSGSYSVALTNGVATY